MSTRARQSLRRLSGGVRVLAFGAVLGSFVLTSFASVHASATPRGAAQAHLEDGRTPCDDAHDALHCLICHLLRHGAHPSRAARARQAGTTPRRPADRHRVHGVRRAVRSRRRSRAPPGFAR